MLGVVKVTVTLLLFVYVSRLIDYQSLGLVLLNANLYFIGLALVASFLAVMVSAIRWSVILRSIGWQIGKYKIVHYTLAGNFFNQILPSSVGGDAFRIAALLPDGLALGEATQSVVAERIAGSIVLVCWSAIAVLFLVNDLDLSWRMVLAGEIALVICMFAAAVTIHWIGALKNQEKSRALNFLVRFSSLLVDLARNRSTLFPLLVFSIIGQTLGAATIYFLSMSFAESLTFGQAMIIMPPVYLLLTLPISIGGWGLREALLVVGLGLYGVPATSAVLIGLADGLIKLFVGLPSLSYLGLSKDISLSKNR